MMDQEQKTITVEGVSSNELPVVVTFEELQKLVEKGVVKVKATRIRLSVLQYLTRDAPSWSGPDAGEDPDD